MGRYQLLEEGALADCALDLEARELHDLFETAASALAEVMVDPATVEPTVDRILTLKAPQLDLVLYDWLSELIFRKDRDREVLTRAKVWMSGSGPFRLSAHVWGGVIAYTSGALLPRAL